MKTTTKEIRHCVPYYFNNLRHPIKVLLAGIGGTGCIVAGNLLRIHMTLKALGHQGLTVLLFDGDQVTEANIGRQLFYKDDIWKYKARVIADQLNAKAGEYMFHAYNSMVEKNTFYKTNSMFGTYGLDVKANILISCVDSVESRQVFNWALRRSTGEDMEHITYYWLDLGNTFNSGQAVLGSKLIPQPKSNDTQCKLPSVFEMMPGAMGEVRDSHLPSCSLAEAIEKQDLFINPTVADMGCHMLWQLLRQGYITYNAEFVNLESGQRGRNKL